MWNLQSRQTFWTMYDGVSSVRKLPRKTIHSHAPGNHFHFSFVLFLRLFNQCVHTYVSSHVFFMTTWTYACCHLNRLSTKCSRGLRRNENFKTNQPTFDVFRNYSGALASLLRARQKFLKMQSKSISFCKIISK